MPQGPGQDELTDSWDAVGEAKFYVIGRISQKSFLADKAEGQDWRDSITYRSAANNGQFAYTVDGLIPGETYRFIVGSSSGRYDKPQWSPWSGLVKLQLPCLGDRDALVALYNSTRRAELIDWVHTGCVV